MQNWLGAALLALACWGFWGFLPKLALQTLDQRSVLIFQTLGSVIVGTGVLISLRFQPQWHPQGALFAVLTGISGLVGFLFYLTALRRGNASVVITLTALYPFLSTLLAFVILKEPISGRKLLGFGFALVAIVLFST